MPLVAEISPKNQHRLEELLGSSDRLKVVVPASLVMTLVKLFHDDPVVGPDTAARLSV